MISARLTFAVYLLAATAGAMLYRTSYAVDEVRAKITESERQIVAEQENIQVLGAEWTYLTEPSRIEALASKYLHLETTKTQRVAALHDMNRVVAQQAPIAAAPAVIAAATIAKPPLIAPMAESVAAPTPTAAPVLNATIKPLVTASAVPSAPQKLQQPRAQQVQPATPGSVKLLLASFQTAR